MLCLKAQLLPVLPTFLNSSGAALLFLLQVVLELADGVTLCMTLAGCHVLW